MIHSIRRLAVQAFLVIVMGASTLPAADWPQWRGPQLNGSTEAKNLPVQWSPENNTRWRTELPGEGASTPVVANNRIFLTSTDRQNQDLHALCFDAVSGKEFWRKTIPGRGRKANFNTDASPSPIVGTDWVCFMFGTGKMLAFTHKGEPLWERDLEGEIGPLSLKYLYGSSPLLYDGNLYVPVLRENTTKRYAIHGEYGKPLDSWLLCIDPKTGKDRWKQQRTYNEIGQESRDSYSTPLAYEWNGQGEIVLIGGNCLTGHDPKTGKERWRYRYLPDDAVQQRVVPTPLFALGWILASLPRHGRLFALAPGKTGEVSEEQIAWSAEIDTPDVPSILAYGERLYIVHDRKKKLTCFNPSTQTAVWVGELDGKSNYHASPVAADGIIYCINLDGEMTVVAAEDTFQILGRNSMGESPCQSTPAIANNSLFIRTSQALYCISTADQ